MPEAAPIKGGYVVLARTSLDSKLWQCGPDAVRLAVYLILQARYKIEPKKYPGFVIGRGEVLTSLSLIADDCSWFENRRVHKWSRGKVSRMLEALINIGFCESKSDTYGTHLKICNYELYQNLDNYKSDSNGTTPDITRTVTGHNSNKGKKGKKGNNIFPADSIEISLSKELFNSIFERNDKIKQPNLQTWAKHVDLMLRVDNRSPRDISRIIRWSQSDKFWQNNILSTAKLREHFDKLLLKSGESKSRDKIAKLADGREVQF
jgi:hypothetical protein